MPTIKLKNGKVVTKGGKPSCVCCCVCDFYIFADLYVEEFDPTAHRADVYVQNYSSCPLEVVSLAFANGTDPVLATVVFPGEMPGNSVFSFSINPGDGEVYQGEGTIQGRDVIAETSCGGFIFHIGTVD
jgi:hypothetical protein